MRGAGKYKPFKNLRSGMNYFVSHDVKTGGSAHPGRLGEPVIRARLERVLYILCGIVMGGEIVKSGRSRKKYMYSSCGSPKSDCWSAWRSLSGLCKKTYSKNLTNRLTIMLSYDTFQLDENNRTFNLM